MIATKVPPEANAQFREHMTSKEDLLFAVEDLIPRFAKEEAAATEGAGPELERQISELLLHMHRVHVDRIFDHSGSEIEKIFLSSLLFGFLTVDPAGIHVGAPSADAPTLVREKQEGFRAARHVRLLCETHNKRVTDYIAWKKDEGMEPDEIAHWEMMTAVEPLLGESFQVIPQAGFPELKVSGKKIRVDLLIWVGLRPDLKIVVECDGFEWHRDRATFTADRQRDRVLQANGYQVIRYSGHEIYNQPVESALDLYGRLDAIRKEWKPLPAPDMENNEWSSSDDTPASPQADGA